MSDRKRQVIRILVILALVVVLDQVSKTIIIHTIPPGSVSLEGREREFFYFTHERNFGLVGGTFRNVPWLANTLPYLACAVLLYLYHFLDVKSWLQTTAYGMVAGGALGNIIDRLRLGSVTDFLQFHFYFIPFDFPWKRYPAFNLADSAICIGVVLLVLSWRRMDISDAADTD